MSSYYKIQWKNVFMIVVCLLTTFGFYGVYSFQLHNNVCLLSDLNQSPVLILMLINIVVSPAPYYYLFNSWMNIELFDTSLVDTSLFGVWIAISGTATMFTILFSLIFYESAKCLLTNKSTQFLTIFSYSSSILWIFFTLICICAALVTILNSIRQISWKSIKNFLVSLSRVFIVEISDIELNSKSKKIQTHFDMESIVLDDQISIVTLVD